MKKTHATRLGVRMACYALLRIEYCMEAARSREEWVDDFPYKTDAIPSHQSFVVLGSVFLVSFCKMAYLFYNTAFGRTMRVLSGGRVLAFPDVNNTSLEEATQQASRPNDMGGRVVVAW